MMVLNGLTFPRITLKRFYCANCGNKLKTEKTHRMVTKDDKDYYQYHSKRHFPRIPHEVRSRRFRCPICESRFCYTDQIIIDMIQKKCLRKRLSPSELNRYYDQYKSEASKKILHQNIFVSVLFFVALYLLYYFMAGDNFNSNWFITGMFMAIFASIYIVNMIDKHNGKGGDNAYSFEEITKFERLHTYSTHNKENVDASQKCYCYFCLSTINKEDIKEYVDDVQTALCPECDKPALIPDSVAGEIDDHTLYQMSDYWY